MDGISIQAKGPLANKVLNRIDFLLLYGIEVGDWSKTESPRRRCHFRVREIRFDSIQRFYLQINCKIVILENNRIESNRIQFEKFVHLDVACST